MRVGVDLGGTKIEGVVLADDLSVVERRRMPTRREEGYDAIVGRVAGLTREMLAIAGEDATVGIGTPGSVSKTGLLRNSNTTCLNGRRLGEDLAAALGRPLRLENDANCFALAEATLGAARGHSVVFGVILGTGVGGGVVIEGRLHSGRLGIAGEWGHGRLHPEGRPCWCGRRGCVERYLSGPALEQRFAELAGQPLPLPEIVATLDVRQPSHRRFRDEWLDDFAVALAWVIDVLDPDAIVLGGGVSNAPLLYDEGRDAVLRQVFSDDKDTPILRHALGDSAGVLGAALLG